MRAWAGSAGKLPQEFLFVHPVLEDFSSVDKDDRDLIIVLAAQLCIRIYVYFSPVKAAALMEFDEALLDDLAEMTTLAGIYDDFPWLHRRAV